MRKLKTFKLPIGKTLKKRIFLKILLEIVDLFKTVFLSYYAKIRGFEVDVFLLQILNTDCLYFMAKLQTFQYPTNKTPKIEFSEEFKPEIRGSFHPHQAIFNRPYFLIDKICTSGNLLLKRAFSKLQNELFGVKIEVDKNFQDFHEHPIYESY